MLQSNIVKPSSTLFFLLSALVLSSFSAPPLQNTTQTISIQTTKEIFMSYIPLTSNCNYPETLTVLPGKLDYTELDPVTIFESIEVVDEVFFWGAVLDGMRMIVNQEELLQNGQYDQVVLFNSTISSNFTQREVILVQVDTIGNIVFTYAEPMYNYSSNTLTPSPISQVTFSLGDQIAKIVRDCSAIGNTVKITYAGDDLFLGLCPNTSNLFAWDASNVTRRNVYGNVSFMNGDNIQNMTGNPYLLLPGVTVNINQMQQLAELEWNIVFLGQQNTDAYFCEVNLTSITCQNHENSQLWTQIVFQRAWGLEATAQLSQIQFILSQFPQITSFTFPGSITSIFSYSSTIFIQSTDLNTTYLSIFQSGNQLANVTLKGGVVYYGRENLVIQENGTFWVVDFILPIHYISNDLYPRQNVTYYIDCGDVQYQLNYNIFWSDIAYPSYFIQQIDSQPQVSYQNVKIDSLQNFYTVIGPAFEIFIGTNDNNAVNITLLDISEMLGIQGFINIVSIVLVSSAQTSIPKYFFFLDLQGILKRYKLSSKQVYTMPAPCGYSNFIVSQVLQNGILFISNSGICLCTTNLATCSPVSQLQLPRIVLENTATKADYALKMKKILKAQGDSISSSSDNAIKKQLLAVVNQDLIVNIYENNTVTLTNFQGLVIDMILPNSTNCLTYNSTDGTIFSRNFYDDYLILFCYSSPTITQYLIRNEKFMYNREVPLYGFITVQDNTAVQSGTNYVFLEVDLDPLFFGDAKVKANNTNCCILRLDPDQFTVGVIAEIILANKLLAVQSMFGVDIVFYNQTDVSTSMPFIKIYFDSSWISYQQFTVCTPSSGCAPTTYPYMLTFISNFYNFAAMYLQSITFNVTASAITVTNVPSILDVQMAKYITNYTFYNSSSLYNFNNFCGPIQSFHQANQNLSFGSIFSITINTILIKNKEITSNYSDIFQIVDFDDVAPRTSFAGLVMVVGVRNLSFYGKYDGVWMAMVGVVQSTQDNCVYFLSQIVDNYTIVLGSDCYNLQIQNPLITLTYNHSLEDPFNVTFATMQLPIQLRSITTVLNGNTTQNLGIQQGPSKSVSGVLYLCENVCNCLSTQTKQVFFIDYDQQQTSEGLLIVGLDVYKLFFWINPTLSPDSSATIDADYLIDYQSQLGYACSKVKIVYGSLSRPNIILSCPNGYLQVVVDFATGLITTQNQLSFAKFANCQQIDRFKPQIILSPGSLTEIIFLAVECQQNIDTVRLQEIYALNSNTTVNIITGYLQIYTFTGPQCNGKWYPLRILDLGTSSQDMSYLIYYANSQWKLLYEAINGILIDAFIDMTPRSEYELIQLTKDVNYPEVLMTIKNPYYELGLIIQTNPEKLDVPGAYFDLALSFFILFNVVTVVFFLCWCLFSRTAKRTFHSKYFNEQFLNKSSIFTSSDSKASYLNILDKSSIVSGNSHAPSEDRPSVDSAQHSSNPGDISVYQQLSRLPVKKRGTEIELFQPR